jgi:hypothetical protein
MIVRIVSSISAVRAKAQALRLPAGIFRVPDHDVARNAASFCYRRTVLLVTGRKLRPFLSKLIARLVLVAQTARDVAYVRPGRLFHGSAVGCSFTG